MRRNYITGIPDIDIIILKYVPDEDLVNVCLNHALLELCKSDYLWREKIQLLPAGDVMILHKPNNIIYSAYYFLLKSNPPSSDEISQALHLSSEESYIRALTEAGVIFSGSEKYQSKIFLLPQVIKAGNKSLIDEYLHEMLMTKDLCFFPSYVMTAAIKYNNLPLLSSILDKIFVFNAPQEPTSLRRPIALSLLKRIARDLGEYSKDLSTRNYYMDKFLPLCNKAGINNTINIYFITGLVKGHCNDLAIEMLETQRIAINSSLIKAAFRSNNNDFISHIKQGIITSDAITPSAVSDMDYYKLLYQQGNVDDILNMKNADAVDVFQLLCHNGYYTTAIEYYNERIKTDIDDEYIPPFDINSHEALEFYITNFGVSRDIYTHIDFEKIPYKVLVEMCERIDNTWSGISTENNGDLISPHENITEDIAVRGKVFLLHGVCRHQRYDVIIYLINSLRAMIINNPAKHKYILHALTTELNISMSCSDNYDIIIYILLFIHQLCGEDFRALRHFITSNGRYEEDNIIILLSRLVSREITYDQMIGPFLDLWISSS